MSELSSEKSPSTEVDVSPSTASIDPSPSAKVVERQDAEAVSSNAPRAETVASYTNSSGVSITFSGGSSTIIGGPNYGSIVGSNHINYGNAPVNGSVRQQAPEPKAQFIDSFLAQALRQAQITFYLSVIFMTLGGIIVMCAGVAALSTAGEESTAYTLSLVSGLGGIIVGGSGAAFAARANAARKHLAEQASRIHEELLSERRFEQASQLVKGIRNDTLSDQARVSLASMILQPEVSPTNDTTEAEQSDSRSTRRSSRDR